MSTEDISGKKVILIEDDPLLHSLLSDKLTQLHKKGVEVFPTMSAEEGLRLAKETMPHLILLDLMLPSMTGFEFLEQLRQVPGQEKTPVVILSNLSAQFDRERAKKLGVIAYFVKAEFSVSEISGIVEEILRGNGVPVSKDSTPDVHQTADGKYILAL